MSKTPYEIRLELLQLSKDILFDTVHNDRSIRSMEYHSKLTDANRASLAFPAMPPYPSVDDVINKARDLNSFISQDPSQE